MLKKKLTRHHGRQASQTRLQEERKAPARRSLNPVAFCRRCRCSAVALQPSAPLLICAFRAGRALALGVSAVPCLSAPQRLATQRPDDDDDDDDGDDDE